jgi:lysyl endopeptidase
MNKGRLIFLLLSLLAATSAFAQPARVQGEPAWGAQKSVAQLAVRAQGYAESDVALVRFKALGQERINEVLEHNAKQVGKPLQIGIHREARADALTPRNPALVWRYVAGGGQVARLAVSSPGARALRVGLNVRNIPADAELRFINSTSAAVASALVRGNEVKALSREQPVYWTPVTEGEQQVIEFYLAPGTPTALLQFSVTSVSHLIVSPAGRLSGAKVGESESCNKDVACYAQLAGVPDVSRAVARMIFSGQCGMDASAATCLCTGTLLNDSDPNTQIPYFLSANHCISTQSEASTLETYWRYESSACGAGDVISAASQVTGGAALLFNDSANDAVLLKLNNPPPADAYFSGWDSQPVNVDSAVSVIHHPAGDVKKLTLGQVLGFTTISDLGGSYTVVAFTSGSTQGGSSGAGLFTASGGEFFLRGAFYGATGSCSNSGSLADSFNRAFFSRFDQIYPGIKNYIAANSASAISGESAKPPQSATAVTDYSGAWYDPNESGWGISIVRGDSGALGLAMYHYAQSHAPIWYLFQNGSFSGTTFSATVYQYSGPWIGEAYDASMASSSAVGQVTINFSSASNAVFNYSIAGVGSGAKNISKLIF